MQVFYLLPFALIVVSCSPKGPYAVTNKFYKHHADSAAKVVQLEQPAVLVDSTGAQVPSEFVGTVNFNLRKPNYVIIHFTAQDSLAQTLHTFTVTQTQVSAHYVVGKDGKVVHMLNDYLRAWHAGVSRWGSISDMNSCSIGIEIDNNGNEPFSDAQIKSLLALLGYLKKTNNIPATIFDGHTDLLALRIPNL